MAQGISPRNQMTNELQRGATSTTKVGWRSYVYSEPPRHKGPKSQDCLSLALLSWAPRHREPVLWVCPATVIAAAAAAAASPAACSRRRCRFRCRCNRLCCRCRCHRQTFFLPALLPLFAIAGAAANGCGSASTARVPIAAATFSANASPMEAAAARADTTEPPRPLHARANPRRLTRPGGLFVWANMAVQPETGSRVRRTHIWGPRVSQSAPFSPVLRGKTRPRLPSHFWPRIRSEMETRSKMALARTSSGTWIIIILLNEVLLPAWGLSHCILPQD